jgi:hypothetical protein
MYYSMILCSCFSKRGIRISGLNVDISYHDYGFRDFFTSSLKAGIHNLHLRRSALLIILQSEILIIAGAHDKRAPRQINR